MKTINMVEPTLKDQTGHCYSYALSLLGEAKKKKLNIILWGEKRGATLFSADIFKPFFTNKYRKIQQVYLFNKLIKQNKNIFVPITSSFEIQVISFLLSITKKYSGKIFLHFHQYKRRDKKIKLLENMAKKHQEWYMMASTERLAEIFVAAGFKNIQAVSYPVYGSRNSNSNRVVVKRPKLLYIGAAREDKGFIQVVDFIEYAVNKKYDFEFIIQCSTPHGGKHDENIAAAITKLKAIKKTNISLLENTLTEDEYWKCFNGSICFAVYDRSKYADSVSGVLLDSISSHIPVVTTSNTWMSDIILKYQAGEVVDNCLPESLLKAITKIVNDYDNYVDRAKIASTDLVKLYDPKYTINYIERNL
jgi:glycosyltransferase involved in cell wall biosynthesis